MNKYITENGIILLIKKYAELIIKDILNHALQINNQTIKEIYISIFLKDSVIVFKHYIGRNRITKYVLDIDRCRQKEYMHYILNYEIVKNTISTQIIFINKSIFVKGLVSLLNNYIFEEYIITFILSNSVHLDRLYL
jgi:hypothetical protein